MLTTQNILLFVTALLTALITGLFYSYSCSVTIGLGRLNDAEYVRAMQHINRAIQNPLFFISFMGTAVMLPLCTFIHYRGHSSCTGYLLIAMLLYIGGVFCVTVFGNVPLNNALEAFNLSNASPEQITAQRRAFETPWNRLQHIRTIACIAAMAFVILACIKQKA